MKALATVVAADYAEAVFYHGPIAPILLLPGLPEMLDVPWPRGDFHPSKASRALDQSIDSIHAADHIEFGVLEATFSDACLAALSGRKGLSRTASNAQIPTERSGWQRAVPWYIGLGARGALVMTELNLTLAPKTGGISQTVPANLPQASSRSGMPMREIGTDIVRLE